MADNHEGWYIKANVDISELLQANKSVNSLFETIKKVDAGFSNLKGNDALAKSIKSADLATASYIDRLKSEGKEYEANKEKVKLLTGQVDRLKGQQKDLESTLEQVAQKSGKTSDAYNMQKTRINETVTSINRLQGNIKSAQAEMDKIRPTGFNRLSQAAKKVDDATGKMKSKLHDAWDSIKGGATVATGAIGAVGAAALTGAKKAGAIQQTYREINNLAVLGGEKQKEVTSAVTKMQAQGRDMSIKYGKSQQDIAAGYEDLIKRGYTTKQALGAMRTELQASVASGDKFSDVTTVSSQVLDAFGMRANSTSKMIKNTKEVVNELAYSADATSTGFSDLGVAMSYVGTAAKANKISLAETSSALGVLSNNGLESDKAGTALRSTINGLTNQVNKIGTKNSIFTKLGIKKSEMLDAHGNLKGLSEDMAVLYKHIQEHSKGGSDQNGFFKSIFGTTGMNGAEILAKGSKEVEELTKRTEKAGKTGSYVAELAQKNMGTAQGSAASAKQAMTAFQMTLGNAVLPAINKASNELAKFLLTKDGKKFQKDVGDAVAKVAKDLVKLIEWVATHKQEVKMIGAGLLAGYSVSKGLKFISFLGKVRSGLLKLAGAGKEFGGKFVQQLKLVGKGIKGLGSGLWSATKWVGKEFASAGKFLGQQMMSGYKKSLDFGKGLFGKGSGAGKLGGALQSMKSAGGFKNLTTAGKVTTGLAGAGVAIDAGSSFFDAYKDRHNADKRSQDIGKGIGAGIGGGIGLFFGGPLGAAVGSQIGKAVGGWGGQAVNKFTKGWQSKKPPKSFWSLENLGWSTHDMAKKVGKGVGDLAKKSKTFLRKNGAEMGLYLINPLAGAFNSLYKHNKTFHKWVDGLTKWFRNAWSNVAKWFSNLWNGTIKTFKGLWSGIGKFFDGIASGFKKSWDGVVSFFEDIWKKISHIVEPIIKAAQVAGGWIGGAVKGVKGGVAKLTGKAHANGGKQTTSHGALVGEAGPELAYKPYANNVRLLGANGPQFTKVHAGEHILNAKDTARVMSGGLGKGVTLKGYANGNTKPDKSVKKNYSSISKDSTKQLNSLVKNNSKNWKKIESETSKLSKKTKNGAISSYTTMKSKVSKQMDNMDSSVVKTAKNTAKGFGKALDKMNDYAKDAMSDTIKQLNKGINGIDKVLGQFGGNGEVIKPIHFATGTDADGRLTHNTLAMVNDATSGPRQEALVSDKNELFFPRGDNLTMTIPKGWGVLNGTQTQQVAKSAGIRHFAKGSGVSDSVLKKIASKALSDPVKSFAQMFTSNVHSNGSDLNKGTTDLGKNSSTKFGNPWSTAMWTVINDAIGGATGKGGTREKFLNYAKSTFSGVKYVMGAASKAASDCSGMVMQALSHFGINAGRSTVDMQHSSSLQYLGKNLSKTLPGDLVIFGHGTGAAGHVGIIDNPNKGTMFNETPPQARVTNISDDKGMGYGYYRVKGLHNAEATKKQSTANKSLMALAKRELGPGAIKWIKNHLGDEGSLGGNVGGDGVQRWAGTVKKILGMLGLSQSNAMVNRVLRQINTESSGNPHARQPGADPDGDGSGPALGLMQTKRATFDAYKRKGAGNIFNGPDNIYAGLNYAKHKYGPSLSFLGQGHGYAKGGNHHDQTPFIAGENGPELITANGPVHIDTHEQTRRKMKALSRDMEAKPTSKGKFGSNPITINLNFNGNISSEADMRRMANIAKQEIVRELERLFNHAEGADPSVY